MIIIKQVEPIQLIYIQPAQGIVSLTTAERNFPGNQPAGSNGGKSDHLSI
jgi:hypothetical protein